MLYEAIFRFEVVEFVARYVVVVFAVLFARTW
jgi:hypothetical protein